MLGYRPEAELSREELIDEVKYLRSMIDNAHQIIIDQTTIIKVYSEKENRRYIDANDYVPEPEDDRGY